MKMVSNSNWKRTNVQLVSLACGLALAAAVVGGYEVLRDRENTTIISPARVAQPVGPVMDEPDFGSVGIDFTLNGLAAQNAAAAGLQDARGIGQPGEGTQSVTATLIDPTDFASSFANHRAAQQFGTMADAAQAAEAYVTALEATLIDPTELGSLGIAAEAPGAATSVVDPHFGTGVESVSAIESDYLGIGQPGEGTKSVGAGAYMTALESTLFDPTVFGSLSIGQPGEARASEAPLFGTMVDAVYVMEGEILLP